MIKAINASFSETSPSFHFYFETLNPDVLVGRPLLVAAAQEKKKKMAIVRFAELSAPSLLNRPFY